MPQIKFINIIKNFFYDFLIKKEIQKIIQESEESTFLEDDMDYDDVVKPNEIPYPIKHTNDKIVYIPQYATFKSSVPEQEQRFKKENRGLSEENYIDLLKKTISLDDFISKNKIFPLFNIWSDAKKLNDVLLPLKEMNIKYTLDLTGGSVRDFLLDNHDKIKDLDFMLSIEEHTISDLLEKMEKYFSAEELRSAGFKIDEKFIKKIEARGIQTAFNNSTQEEFTENLDSLKVCLLKLCFNRSNKTYDLFSKNKRLVEISISQDNNYLSETKKKDRLMAVIKIDNENFDTKFPIDILLTDFIKPEFLQDFDFDICKASICFVNDSIKKKFPDTPYELVGRFVADDEFWADVFNKKITYNIDKRNKYEIDRSFGDHLDRILSKYPDFEVNIVGNEKDAINYIETKLFAKKLSKELNSDKPIIYKEEVKARKIKI